MIEPDGTYTCGVCPLAYHYPGEYPKSRHCSISLVTTLAHQTCVDLPALTQKLTDTIDLYEGRLRVYKYALARATLTKPIKNAANAPLEESNIES